MVPTGSVKWAHGRECVSAHRGLYVPLSLHLSSRFSPCFSSSLCLPLLCPPPSLLSLSPTYPRPPSLSLSLPLHLSPQCVRVYVGLRVRARVRVCVCSTAHVFVCARRQIRAASAYITWAHSWGTRLSQTRERHGMAGLNYDVRMYDLISVAKSYSEAMAIVWCVSTPSRRVVVCGAPVGDALASPLP